jgi:hypothetical protein
MGDIDAEIIALTEVLSVFSCFPSRFLVHTALMLTYSSCMPYRGCTGQELSERPDKWYENPCGWLPRPSYKRSTQKRGNEGRRTSWKDTVKEAFSGNVYKRRWFVLDPSNRTLKYYKEEISTEENGWIDLSRVQGIRYSTVSDAPSYAIDLVSQDIIYTIAGSSKAEILRWAVALYPYISKQINVDSFHARSSTGLELVVSDNNSNGLLLGSGPNDAVNDNNDDFDPAREWLRFDYTLKRDGPLRINVMGTVDRDENDEVLSYWLIVSGFATGPNGEQSEAKLSGQVRPKDYIVGVNGMDITSMEFAAAMSALKSAPMPRTLHFLRDLREQSTTYYESWAWVYYESLNKRRKRYVELSSYALSCRKPLLQGGVNPVRDAYFLIDQIDVMRPFIDKSAADPDQKYLLRLLCKRSSIVNFVGSDDMPVGGSIVESIDICLATREELDKLCYILQHASERLDPLLHTVLKDIHLDPLETIVSKEEEDDSASRVYGLKSFITGTFALRAFDLKDGNLEWKKPHGGKDDGKLPANQHNKARSMFIASSEDCGLKGVAAVVDRLEKNPMFMYQLVLVATDDQTVTIGMPDEVTLLQWLDAIRELVDQSPDHARDGWEVPETIVELDRTVVLRDNNSSVLLGDEGGDDEELYDDPGNEESNVDSNNASKSKKRKSVLARTLSIFVPSGEVPQEVYDKDSLAGYLYYRHNTKALWKKQYSRYYFVLRGMYLLFYKNPQDADAGVSGELGRIELGSVLEVRESRDPTLPDNFLEIVTQERVYCVGAETEASANQWLEALTDMLESRSTVNLTAHTSAAGTLAKNSNPFSPKTGSSPLPAYGSVDPSRRPKVKRSKSIFSLTMSGKNLDKLQQREQQKQQELEEKLDGIRFQGGLGIKCKSKSGALSWKDKYFIITDTSFMAFKSAESVFLDKRVAVDISLANIQLVETSDDKLCPLNCGIDIHSYIGDDPEIKVFTCLAQTSNLAKLWMEKLCDSTGRFELKSKEGAPGMFESVLTNEFQQLTGSSELAKPTEDEDSSNSQHSSENLANNPPPVQTPTTPTAGALYAKRGLLDVRRSQAFNNSPVVGGFGVLDEDGTDDRINDLASASTPPPPPPVNIGGAGAALMQAAALNNVGVAIGTETDFVPTVSTPGGNSSSSTVLAGRGRGRGRGDGSLRRLSASEETIKAMKRAPPPIPTAQISLPNESGEEEEGPTVPERTREASIGTVSEGYDNNASGASKESRKKGVLLGEEDDDDDDDDDDEPTPAMAASTMAPRTSVTAAIGGRGAGVRFAGRGRGFK